MILDASKLDLVKATTWREELHKRDSSGKFAKQASKKVIRTGSKVVAKNGTTGKVVGSTDTHYHIEKEDGKQSKVLKHNVLHEDEHRELTKPKRGGKSSEKKKPASKTSTTVKQPKKATTGARRGTKNEPALVVGTSSSVPGKTTRKPSATKTPSKVGKKEEVNAKELAPKVGGKASASSEKTSKKDTNKKPATTKKGAGASAKSKPTGAGKAVSKPNTTATKGGAKSATTAKKGAVKDIRSEVQKNRTLAYDVGDKVGGARKDSFEQMFKEKPTMQNLAELEKDSGAVAEKLVTKKNLLPAYSFEEEHANGTDLTTALMKKLIFDRIAPKPEKNTPEERKAYMESMQKLHRQLGGIKTWENMRNAIRELADIGYKGATGRTSERTMDSYREIPGRFSYINEEYHNKRIEDGKKARAMLDMSPLGNKLESFFTNYKSREATMKTVNKNASEGWDKYLNPETKAKNGGTPKGGENKRWERKAEAKDLRTGGKAIKVQKPEELMKDFGVRGVEFGNWVNDSSGKYHLQRCAEAFSDLADTLGIEDKDIALNGRLAIAFGARGKGGALAHYEPSRKVINMTKHGGAGSLAHEWGHAMDNILFQYMNGGGESLGLASEHLGSLGGKDPKLKELYKRLNTVMKEPAPGEKGGMKTIVIDSEKTKAKSYYPKMRKQVREDGKGAEEIYHEWTSSINSKYDNAIARVKENRLGFYTDERKEKEITSYERQRTRDINQIAGMIAYEMQQHTGKPFRMEVQVPTGKSNFYSQMMQMDGGKAGKYFSQSAEMFARVFESYVQHKLDANKQYNNYLVHGTREKDVKEFGAPFPAGKEREHIFKAMGNLLGYVAKNGALKKALIYDLVKGRSVYDIFDNLWQDTLDKDIARLKGLGVNTTGIESKRSAYMVDFASLSVPVSDVLYIPTNRLRTPYQTDKATNWDKVRENVDKMVEGIPLKPVAIGLDYDIQDGHHRYEASKLLDYEHVPCIVKSGSDIERQRAIEAYKELWKSFDESRVKRDVVGRFSNKQMVYHTTKDPNFKHDPAYRNSGQEWGAGLYTAPAEGVEYWNRALRDKTTGEGHPYVIPMDISEARLLHTYDMPDRATRARIIMKQFGSDARDALRNEEMEFVNGETYDMRPHEIAENRLYAKIHGYDGIVAHDEKEGHQIVLFDDSKVKYGDTLGIDDFLKKRRHGEL